jgi:hypothetical protein
MNRAILRRLKTIDAETVLETLSTRQHLGPRKPLADVLTEVAAMMGLTLTSVRRAAERMELDMTRSVGRLTRAELDHLSRLIHRTYRHELTGAC